jgi:hypothetical protein
MANSPLANLYSTPGRSPGSSFENSMPTKWAGNPKEHFAAQQNPQN